MTHDDRPAAPAGPPGSSRVALARGLSIAGGAFVILGSLLPLVAVVALPADRVEAMMPATLAVAWPVLLGVALIWGLAVGALVLWGARRIHRAEHMEDVRGGGLVVVVAGALALVTTGGFLLGSLLAIVGGVLAITADPAGEPEHAGEPV